MQQLMARFFVSATRPFKLPAIYTTSTPSLSKNPQSLARPPSQDVLSSFSRFLAFVAPPSPPGLLCWLSKCTSTITSPLYPLANTLSLGAESTLSPSTQLQSSSTSVSPHTTHSGLRSVSDLSTSHSRSPQSGQLTRSVDEVSCCSPSPIWLGHCLPRVSASGFLWKVVLACR